MAKKTRFAFRTTDDFKQRIAKVSETLGLDQAVVGEAALEAVVSYVEKYGELTIPIRLERHREKKDEPERVTSAVGSRQSSSGRQSSSPPTATGLNEPEGEYPRRKKP